MTIIATTAMQNALATQMNFQWADLYTFATAEFGTTRFCGGSLPLQITGFGFPDPNSLNSLSSIGSTTLEFGVGLPFSRSEVTREVGTNPSKISIEIGAGINDIFIGNLTWQQVIDFGGFEQCIVEVDRYLPGPGGWLDVTNGTIVWFYGQIGDIEYGRSKIKMDVLSLLTTMNQQQMPRRVYASSCTHVFGDAMCQFDRSSLGVVVTALAGSAQNTIVTNLVPSPTNLYDEGSAVGVSGHGLNAPFTRTISTMSGGIVNLVGEFPYPITPGSDQFTLLPGCPHSVAACQNVFNNLIHYGGMPYIPPPELAI
jgi:uncharacterized phage protein (TIGR02218 family)